MGSPNGQATFGALHGLVLRAWTEGGLPGGLRVRVTVLDGARGESVSVAFTDPDAAADAVREWLHGLGRSSDE